MAKVNTGISLDEAVLKAVDEDAKKSGVSRNVQIEYELALPRGLWRPRTPKLPPKRPQHDSPKAARG